jgi:hypothetical protein
VHFHERAAREFDRQMEAARRNEEDSQKKSDQADQVEHQRMAHEGDGAVDSKKFHVSLLPAV